MTTRQIEFEGRRITVPSDATDEEVASILGSSAPVPNAQLQQMYDAGKGDASITLGNVLKGAVGGASRMGNQLIQASTYVPRTILKLAKKASGKDGKHLDVMTPAVDYLESGTKDYETDNKNLPGYGTGELAVQVAGTAGVPFAKSGGYVTNVLKNAALGAGTAQYTGQDVEGGAKTGAALSVIIPGLGFLGNKGVDLANRWIGGAREQVIKHLDDLATTGKISKQQAADALDSLKALVPGEQVTSGRAAVSTDTNFPFLKALEEKARAGRNVSQELSNIDKANIAATTKPLENIAEPGRRYYNPVSNSTDMSAAEQLRSRVTNPLYASADPDMVAVTPNIQKIVGVGDIPQPKAAKQFSGLGNEQPPYVKPRYAGRSIAELQGVKNELTTRINALDGATDGQSKLMLDELVSQRKVLNDEMRKQSGKYALASDTFANYSQPQNQADVAQVLLDSLVNPQGKTTAGSYLAARENAARTIKKAGGSSRAENIEELLTPTQRKDIAGVTARMLRESKYDALKAGGSMLPEFTSAAGVAEKQLPPWFGAAWTALRRGLRSASGFADEASQKLLDSAVVDPKLMANLLRSTPHKTKLEVVRKIASDKSVKNVAKSAAINTLIGEQDATE